VPAPGFSRDEVKAAYDAVVEARSRCERGELGWDALADFFTEDAVFVDPAWGRVRGRGAIRRFLVESMSGLEGWTFPREWTAIEGERLVSGWQNRLPGRRSDGSFYQAPGISSLIYAGGGRFSLEEDVLNMVHVLELIRESGWRPGPGFTPPPPRPPR
jgi:ketosteroid isomerase-like protein